MRARVLRATTQAKPGPTCDPATLYNARAPGARQSSKLYARTCAEGDDASETRADVQSDGNPFFARPDFPSGIPSSVSTIL
jgi:hypothetical protein